MPNISTTREKARLVPVIWNTNDCVGANIGIVAMSGEAFAYKPFGSHLTTDTEPQTSAFRTKTDKG